MASTASGNSSAPALGYTALTALLLTWEVVEPCDSWVKVDTLTAAQANRHSSSCHYCARTQTEPRAVVFLIL